PRGAARLRWRRRVPCRLGARRKVRKRVRMRGHIERTGCSRRHIQNRKTEPAIVRLRVIVENTAEIRGLPPLIRRLRHRSGEVARNELERIALGVVFTDRHLKTELPVDAAWRQGERT